MAFLEKLFGSAIATPTKEEEIYEETAKFVEHILKKMDEICDVETNFDESTNTCTLNIIGGDAGRIIGHKGETLENLRFLAKIVMFNKLKNKENKPQVVLDIAGYAQKRKEAIACQVKEAIKKMERLGKYSILLDYMSAYDRKIAHEVAGTMGYTSDSTGQGRERRVKIKAKSGND